jgi:hypothetical protein
MIANSNLPRAAAFRQTAFRKEFYMGELALAAVCPNHGAFLLVEIKKRCGNSGCYRQINGNRRLSDSTLLGNESNCLHQCDPSKVHCFRCAFHQVCTSDAQMDVFSKAVK